MSVKRSNLCKAFDRVNIKRLLFKLETVGAGNPLLAWLQSCHCQHSQVVRIGSIISSIIIDWSSRAPQGVCTFLLFTNNIGNTSSTCNFLLSTGDIKMNTENL